MPAVIRRQTRYSLLQRFRVWSERILIEAAQDEVQRKYPQAGARPLRRGRLRSILRTGFKVSFRLVPAAIRNRLMRAMLVRKGQDWNPA
jgi:hypothetical protein